MNKQKMIRIINILDIIEKDFKIIKFTISGNKIVINLEINNGS